MNVVISNGEPDKAEQYGNLKLLNGAIEKLRDFTYATTGRLRRKVTMSEALTMAVDIAERNTDSPTPLSDEDDPRLTGRSVDMRERA
jgi:hypothetical protein